MSQSVVRVLHLRSSPFVGSPEKLLLAQLKHLMATGIEYHFGVLDEQEPSENDFASSLKLRGCNVFLLDQRLSRLGSVMRLLTKQVRLLKINVLCTHDYKATFYGIAVGLITRTPVVVICHGRTAHNVKSRIYEAIDARIMRLAHVVVVVSQAMKADLVRSGIDERRILVITNGIEVSEGKKGGGQFRRELGIGQLDPLIVFLGRLSKEKGLYILLEALKQVREVIPRVSIALVGDGPERESLHETVPASGLTGIVRLVGYRRDVDAVLQDMDMLVLPSFREGMPLVILEAFARARPVVASQVGGIPELVENNVNGILVEPGDVRALANALIAMIQDPKRARRMGEAGYQRVAASHTVSRQTAEFMKLFSECSMHAHDGSAHA